MASRRRTLAFCLGLAVGMPSARADWAVQRDAHDPALMETLYGALLKTPDDRSALRRLTARASKAERLRLAERCDRQRASALACGHLYREGGDAERALAAYARADDPRAKSAAGALLVTLGRYDDALRSFESAPSSTANLEQRLALYGRAQGRPLDERRRLADADATELLAHGGDRPRIAEALAAVGDTARAAQLYDELAAHGDPVTRVPLYFRAAELDAEAERWDEALRALDAATTLLPPGDGRRREALERQVDLERKRDRLPQLAQKLAAMPHRDAATEALLGRLLDETGDTSGAQLHLRRAVELDPRDVAARRQLVRLYLRAGDDDAAIAELRKLDAATGNEPRVVLELAERLHARPGGEAEANALVSRLAGRDRSAGTHSALAVLYQKWGDTGRALKESELLVRLEPGEPEHLIALGEVYEQRGDKAMARRVWQRLAPTDKAPLAARLRLADVLAEHDEPGEALALVERAAHDRPDDPAVQRKLADVLDRLRRDVEAELIYRRLLEGAATRDEGSAVRELGARWFELATRRGSLATALPRLESLATSAHGVTATELTLLVARGEVRQRHFTQAEQLLRVAAAHAQPSDRGRLLEARAELVAAQSETRGAEALDLLVEAAKADEPRAPMLYGKASARAAALYRDEDALRYAERAVAIAPTDPDAQERLGALLETRDPTRALTAYDRALELDQGRDRLRLRAAELALRRGDDEGAARRYRQLLAHARDEQAIEEAAHRAVVVHELTGRLGLLEREIGPRVSGGDPQPALRRLLIEVDRRYVPALAARAEAGEPAARAELEHVAQHALGPLLDGIVEGERDERRAAVQLTGQLGARGAAPLLLRLAAGEAARRGSEPPPIELRTAAAEAAVSLVGVAEIPKLVALAADPEQRIRVAAVLALGRLAKDDARADGAIEHALLDGHQSVVAAACLAIPPGHPVKAPLQLTTIALDEARPLAARACSALLADRAMLSDAPEDDLLVVGAKGRPRLSIGIARALLAGAEASSVERGLLSLLAEPALHRAAPVPAPPATLDLAEAIAAREARSLPPRHPDAIEGAWLRLLASDDAEVALADLLVDVPLAPRLIAGDGHEAARAELVERAATQLARLATSYKAPVRALAIALASETATCLPVIEAALQRNNDRRAALHALAGPRAAPLSAVVAQRFVPALRSALASVDWRQRRAALLAVARHPELRTRLVAETERLASDENGLVAGLAGTLHAAPR